MLKMVALFPKPELATYMKDEVLLTPFGTSQVQDLAQMRAALAERFQDDKVEIVLCDATVTKSPRTCQGPRWCVWGSSKRWVTLAQFQEGRRGALQLSGWLVTIISPVQGWPPCWRWHARAAADNHDHEGQPRLRVAVARRPRLARNARTPGTCLTGSWPVDVAVAASDCRES